jgi:ATP-dependent DNA helicase RecG
MLFLKKHAYRTADLSEVRRKDVWSIPLGILREVIINAIVHSDYSQRGAPIRVVFLDDRIEVESMGILLPGLTIEEMKQGTSRIRNPVIARVFKELNLIEQWGTGVRRIFAEAKELGLPEPNIEEVGMRLRFTVRLAKQHRIETGAQTHKSGVESGVESKITGQVLSFLKEQSRSKSELAKLLGKNKPTRYLNGLMVRLLNDEYVEYTIPDKPNSRLQKYRLTEKGRMALEG